MHYYRGGEAALKVSWLPPGGDRLDVVPASVLGHFGNGAEAAEPQ